MDSHPNPLVSVICLCYNQARFVKTAIVSVQGQTYPHIELIVVDDGSKDGSPEVISRLLEELPNAKFISLKQNKGNCYAFNAGLALAKGKYVIDLAADDWFHAERVAKQVAVFETLPEDYGVIFHDAYLTNEQGKVFGTYYPRDGDGRLLQSVPSGWVYVQLLKRQFICTPTMMMRNAMLDKLGGYDASLSYEDYDLWVRSGRGYQYFFQDELLTYRRVVANSHGQQFYKTKKNEHLASTLVICKKAAKLNTTSEENAALAISVRYHLRLTIFTQNTHLSKAFFTLLKMLGEHKWYDNLWMVLARLRLPLAYWHRLYLGLKMKTGE